MTVLLTLFAVVFVFPISCFTAGFKAAMKRIGMFALTGLVIDVLLGTLAFLYSYCFMF